jgi:hypothetical protein
MIIIFERRKLIAPNRRDALLERLDRLSLAISSFQDSLKRKAQSA